MPIGRGRSAAPIPRAAFEARLRRWYEPTDEARIGDDSSSGGTLWVWIQQGGRRFHLNANTTQEGVGEYLAMLTREPKLKWAVVRGRAGRLMKVVFGRRQQVIPGFYLYAKASPAESDTYARRSRFDRAAEPVTGTGLPHPCSHADRPPGWSRCWSGGRSATVTRSLRCSAAGAWGWFTRARTSDWGGRRP